MNGQELIAATVRGDVLTSEQLSTMAEYIAQAGFAPDRQELAGSRLVGIIWQGQVLHRTSRIPAADAHYLRHVIAREEWPCGTSRADYVRSIAAVIRDPATGIFTSVMSGQPQVGFLRKSGLLRGPQGYDWVLVEYQVLFGYWRTAFQPYRGLGHLADPQRSELRWLRSPRS